MTRHGTNTKIDSENSKPIEDRKSETGRNTTTADQSDKDHGSRRQPPTDSPILRDKRALGAQAAKGALVPEVEYKAAMYDMGRGKTGIKASAFKMAMVDACPFVGSIPKTKARGSFFVMGDLLEIRGKHHMHTAHARNPTTKNADIRYRPEYAKWEVDLVIRYNANVISPAQILNLLANAGFSIGVGDWRPAKSGTHGMFHVKGK